MVVEVNTSKCFRCAGCVSVCPVMALTLDEVCITCDDKCTNCGTCVKACPASALSLKK